MQLVPRLKRIPHLSVLMYATIALALAFVVALLAQPADFSRLQPLEPLSCGQEPPPVGAGPEAPKLLRCQANVELSSLDPAMAGGVTGRPVDLALLAPVFRDSLVLAVNGVPVGQARLSQRRMPGRLATTPAMILIPRENLRPGINRLDIAVWGLAGRVPSLGKLYVGHESAVIEQFRKLWFVTEVLPTLILGGQAALALMFFTIWNRRRQETAFGWFALVLLLDTLRGSPIVPGLGIGSSSVSYWSLLVPFSSAAYLMFACALVARPNTWRMWLAWVGPVLIAAAAIGVTPAVATGVLMPLGVAVIFVNLLWAVGVLAIGWRRRAPEARLLLVCTLLFAALVLHDVMLSLQLIEGQMAIARPGLLVLLIAMIILMMNRFTAAMAELDQTAETLRDRTTEIEAQLRLVDEKLRKEREAAILEQERARLMRDLHDGLGGEMVAILALAERGQGKDEEIAYHARAALADMRLIIASLEDYGGDLGMALGAWKERAEPQILASGMALHWELGDVGCNALFGPTQVLDILRIIQEALTNVIHHSGATNITVRAQLTDCQLTLSFIDDGNGISPLARRGKGLANMHRRAATLRGALAIQTSNVGTSVELRMPLSPTQLTS